MTTQQGDIFGHIHDTIDAIELDHHSSLLYIGDHGWPTSLSSGYNISDMQELLRRYEPVMRFASGEKFFPMSAMLFMFTSRIWTTQRWNWGNSHFPDDFPAYSRNGKYPDAVSRYFEPNPSNVQQRLCDKLQWLFALPPKPRFHMHFADSIRMRWLYRMSLFLPKSSCRNAESKYKTLMGQQPPCYYGRIAHYAFGPEGGTQDHFRVLQYWFFYPFNDWGLGWISKGLNWHEGDWESISIIGRIPNGDLSDFRPHNFEPVWTAYAAHLHQGNRIRRCWDHVERICDTHPVVYIGRGSHASYYEDGRHNRQFGFNLDNADARGLIVAPDEVLPLFQNGDHDVTGWATPRLILDCSNFPELIPSNDKSNKLPRHWLTLNSNWGCMPGEAIKDLVNLATRKLSRGKIDPIRLIVRLQDGPEGLLDPERDTSQNFIKWAGIDDANVGECQHS